MRAAEDRITTIENEMAKEGQTMITTIDRHKSRAMQPGLWVEAAEDSVLAKLDALRQEGRRQGLGEAVKALRIAIDARFELKPQEFDIGELPEGMDIGEILSAQGRFLNEYGKRCYHDGIEAMKRQAEMDRQG